MKGMKISRSMLLWGGIFLAIVMFLGSYSVKEGFFTQAGDECTKVGAVYGNLRCLQTKEGKVWKEKENKKSS